MNRTMIQEAASVESEDMTCLLPCTLSSLDSVPRPDGYIINNGNQVAEDSRVLWWL